MSAKNDNLNAQKSIHSGYLWLGITNIVAQTLDAVSVFVLMIFLTKVEMGIGTLAWSMTNLIEALSGLGVGIAILQAKEVNKNELDSAFWFIVAAGIACYFLFLPILWIFWNDKTTFEYCLVATVKLPVVAAGVIPLQIINRRLDFKTIAVIQTFATLTSAVAKISLGALSFGAWSLVLANLAYGVVIVLLSFGYSGYLPSRHFSFADIKKHLIFGSKTVGANLLEQWNKNVHYYVIGYFFGNASLGQYRVIYEMIMTPANALLNVVSRSSFAVFSRLQDQKDEFRRIFAWNQRNLLFIVSVPVVFFAFCTEDLLTLIGNPAWYDALPFVPLILVLSFLRSIAQTFPELYRSSGHPGHSLVAAGAEALLLTLVLILASLTLGESYGLIAALWAWIALYPILLAMHRYFADRLIGFSFADMIAPTFPSQVLTLSCVIPATVVSYHRDYIALILSKSDILSFIPPAIPHILLQSLVILFFTAMIARHVLGVSFMKLLKGK